MGLNERRAKFYAIKRTCKIIVKGHAYNDHPKREFSEIELMNLVKSGDGRVTENDSPDAIEDSFLYFPKDEDKEECKVVILLKEVEIVEKDGTTVKETIIVCSAYRKDRL